MTDPVSRYELEDVKRQVAANSDRIERIDQGGTRGVSVLSLQIQDLVKDFAKHELVHEQDSAARERKEREARANRKWWVMAAVGLVAAVDGPLVTLILQHGH